MRVPVLLSVVLSLTLAWVGAPGTLRAEEAAAPAAPPTAVTAGGLSFQVLQECEDPEYCFRFSLTPPAGKAEPYVAKLLFGYQDEKNYYSLALGREAALLTCRSQGVSSKLASWSGPTLRAEGATPLILRREASMLYLVADGRRVLGVLDSTFQAGKVTLQVTTPPAQVSEPQYQPTAEIAFGDDFMRTADQQELGEWTKVRGEWGFHSVRETNKSADFKLSVNPFSLGGKSTDWAMVTAGNWFWDDYEYSASLKSDGAHAGIAFGCVGADAFYLVRLDLRDPKLGAREIQLVRLHGEDRQVLASGYVNAAAGQWFRLGVATRGSCVKVVLDGAVLWEVVDPALSGGGVGLYTEGPNETYFDDIDVNGNPDFEYNRPVWWWRSAGTVSGTWKVAPASGERAILNDSGPVRVTQSAKGEALNLIGDARWGTPILDASVVPPAKGTVGLLYDYKDAGNYRLLRLTGPAAAPQSRIQFLTVGAGKAAVVQEAPGGYFPGRPNAFRLDLSDAGEAKFRLNDVLELAVPREESASGCQGLYTNGAPGTAFGGVRLSLAPPKDVERPVEREAFVKDPYMQHWASPLGQWFPVKGETNTFWHKGDFYGPFTLTVPLLLDTRLTFGATKTEFADGYSLEVTAAEEAGKATLALSKLGHLKAKAAVPVAAGASFTLEKDGRYLWVSVGEERCLAYRDQQPLTGTRVGITSKQALDTTTLQVTRHHVRDFLFEQAPTDWTEWGTWEITNRFSCTPTWSHMSGRSDYAAALWSKYALAGDFTLEYYAGMRMSTTKAMSYPRVGDMNVTFGAEGSDLSTGYSYLVGAWDPGWTSKWTKLVRRAGTVAETDRPLVPRVRTDSGRRYIPVPYVADGRDVHGAWYYCKVRRIGNRIECYYDNELVLTYDETDPLKGHRFGLWTYDNDMVVACLKVSYQRCYAPDRLVPAPLPESSAAEADQVVLTAGCAETPALSADFEQSVGGWKPATSDRNSEVTITGSGAGSGLASLRVKNLTLGGDFGVVAPVPANLDLSRAQELRFRYRLPAGARVNAYVQALGREHFIHLSGASDSNALRQCLGSVDVKTDDEWHDARFDLAAALRALYPAAETIPLQKLTFGNLHPGYVAAGLGGNPFGCRYYLDDVCLAVAGPAERSVTWKPTAPEGKEAPALQYAVAFDRSPDTVPDKLVEGAATTAKSGALKDGLWYFHVRGKASGDKWTSTAHVPLAVSTAALSCLSMSPAPGKPWGGTPVTFQLAPAGGLNLDVTRSSLTVNGQAVPLVSPAMTYDWRARKLTFDAQRSTLAFEQGKPVSVSLAAATTAAEPAAFAWEATFDKSLDRTPPAPVTLAEQFVRDDFEEGLGGWGNLGGEKYALTVLDDSTAAAGKRSLRIVNPVLTGSWSAVPTAQPFSLGKYPLLAFDYKVTEEVCADLLFTLGGETRAVTFADVDDPYLKLGATEAIQKDDQWHHAVLNLGELTRNLSFAPNQYDVTQCYFADTGYQAAAPGAYFNVDNFTLLPAESGALGVKVKLVAHDPSGIAKFRCSWSDQPTDLPVGEVPGDQPEQVFKVEHEGLQYLHVAAQDAAGNWSEPAHYAFLIDNTPPTVAEVTPAANGALGTRTVQVKFAEAPGAALDPKSMAFSVNGNSYPLTALDTGFAPATNQLSWSWCLATGLFSEPVADGTAVKFALSAVKDFAGNASAPQDWTYTVSYAADKEPPLPPEVKCSSHESVVYDTFTRGIGNWTPYGSAYGSQVDRTFDAAKGDYVAAVQLGAGTSYGNYVHIGDYDLATHPMMSFDYKIPAGVQVFFHLYLNGAWYGVPVTGQSRTYTNLGAIPGIAPDGQWHTATVNLLDLAKATVKANAHAVKYLMLCNYGGTGSVVSFDDFHLFGPGANAAVFNWKTVDPTGIKGYSYALDASPVTIPDETPETAAPTATLGNLQPGQYYFHVRAQDGAGNWGPPVHYAYRVG